MDLSDTDRAQLAVRGISAAEAARQLQLLRQPPPPLRLHRPCTIGDGILRLDPAQREALLRTADAVISEGRVTKFVPASGAATRMFKDLMAAAANEERPSRSPAGRTFFERLDDFAFAEQVRQRSGVTGPVRSEAEERAILAALLYDLRYAELPKALIPFHRGQRVRTALEEHLLEAAQYTRAQNGVASAHFTIAPEFRAEFEQALRVTAPHINDDIPEVTLSVSFSEQRPSTDTLAIGLDGQPFRDSDGSLLLRPAGHGALIDNLAALDGDLVVLKNVDNVLPYPRTAEMVQWKRLLIGYLATLWREAPPDRPMRVCGVVRNEGEPGGAPFWVTDQAGRPTLQIVESAQVNLDDPEQQRMFQSATHFSPVDIVCALRSSTGRPFDLAGFVDPSTAFVTRKSHRGREVMALERPGLWNGAMAGWETVFVEVPASTFAPVKTVFDLLRPEHQSL